MIDDAYKQREVEQIVTKVRPKAPNYIRDLKVKRFDEPPDDSADKLHYVEVIDGVTVTYWNCPVIYDTNVGSKMDEAGRMRDNWWWTITYNTLECSCVTWR